MAHKQTPLQRKAVDAIMSQMEHYLDMRCQQVTRINPDIERAWDDTVWQELVRLRTTISTDKAYGPVRLHLAELLISDDRRRVNDLLQSKGQYSLLGEIVEEADQASHKTEGQLEIHDMRTLYRAIDPKVEPLIQLVQTYIWWDLSDACLVARFNWKSDRIKHFVEKGITDEMASYYQELMGKERKPSAEGVVNYECRMLEKTLEEFRLRRDESRGFHVIVRRDPLPAENPDVLIEALASQMALLEKLRKGEELDASTLEQFAKAMHAEQEEVTPEKAAPFLEQTIKTNKKRLREALTHTPSGGEPHSMKNRQLHKLEKRFEEIVGDRDYKEEPKPSTSE